jgi:hypothetical protein
MLMSSRQKSPAKIRIRLSFSLARDAGIVLIVLGALSLATSIFYASSTPALIGLGLIFWGIILTYIQTGEYVKETVLDATTVSTLATLNEALQELYYRGKAVYLPPKYLNHPESNKAYVPRLRSGRLPPPEQTQKLETQPLSRSSLGILITPPGAELTRLFETTLQTSFTKVNLDYLQEHMPKLLIEDLEIASDVEIQTGTSTTSNPIDNAITQIVQEHDRINVKITSTAYKNTAKQTAQLSDTYTTLGSPLVSAIACAIAKATGKPTTIENQQASEDGETLEVEYRTLEEEQPQP